MSFFFRVLCSIVVFGWLTSSVQGYVSSFGGYSGNVFGSCDVGRSCSGFDSSASGSLSIGYCDSGCDDAGCDR